MNKKSVYLLGAGCGFVLSGLTCGGITAASLIFGAGYQLDQSLNEAFDTVALEVEAAEHPRADAAETGAQGLEDPVSEAADPAAED